MKKLAVLAAVMALALAGFSQTASAPTCEERMRSAHRGVIAIEHICDTAKTCPPEIAPMLRDIAKTLEVK